MNVFNRVAMILLLLIALVGGVLVALFPLTTLFIVDQWATTLYNALATLYMTNPWMFYIAQGVTVVGLVLLLGTLLLLEIRRGRPRMVTVVTEEGHQAAIDLDSVAMRLAYHLSQVADVVEAKPQVRARGNALYVTAVVVTSPDIDVPMKTQEILHLLREVVEERMGLRLGKAEVRLKHGPYTPAAEETRVIGSAPQ